MVMVSILQEVIPISMFISLRKKIHVIEFMGRTMLATFFVGIFVQKFPHFLFNVETKELYGIYPISSSSETMDVIIVNQTLPECLPMSLKQIPRLLTV